MNISDNNLENILAQTTATIKNEMGENFSIDKVNLAEMICIKQCPSDL